jgi:hypothetical protein
LPRDITYKRCISLDADKGGASSTGISAAGFRIQSVGTVDATYPRGVIYDNCQAIDTQGSPTMLIGFDCDVATGTAPGDLNKLVNNCRSTGFVTSATNGFTDVNSLTGLYRFDGAAPRLVLLETDAPSNEKNWDTSLVAGDLSRRTRTDADGTGETFELIQRTGTVVDLIRWSATAMRRGSVVDSARYEEADSSGRITRRYSDNSLQNIDTWQNFGIAATGQGLAQTGTFGAGGVSGASAWKIEFAATADWASAGNRSAKITYKVALAGSLVSVLDINPSVGLSILTAGLGLAIKEGSNARSGTSVMIGGTVTVSNTSVSANTRIHYSRTTTGGTVGHVSTTQVNGTSFTLNSSSATETSTFNWFLVEAT